MSKATPGLDGYSLDTNVVIDGRVRRYPPDVFKRLWDSLTTLVVDGRAVIADEVLFELGRGDDDCHEWARLQPGLVAPSDGAVLDVVAEIAREFPDWSSEQQNWADPFVIAHGRCRGWTVVTDEHWSRSPISARTKIPNVCHYFNIKCVSFLDMARREGWTF